MDVLKWGADWLADISLQVCSQTVAVITNGVTRTTKATLCDEAGRLLPGKVPLRTEHTNFLFNAAEVASEGIQFIRGTEIEWEDSLYEVIAESGRYWTYNDTFKKQILVRTKHVFDRASS